MLPRAPGDDDRVVAHLGIPPSLWQTWCPFRASRVPGVSDYLTLFGRVQRYGMPGRGWADQPERDVQAFDLLEWAIRQPLAPAVGD